MSFLSPSDLSEVNADISPPTSSSTPERPSSADNGVAAGNSSFGRALDDASEGMGAIKLSSSEGSFHQEEEESKEDQPSVTGVREQESVASTCPSAMVVEGVSTAAVAVEQGCASNGNAGSIGETVSQQQEIIAIETGSNGEQHVHVHVDAESKDNPEQLLKVEDSYDNAQPLTPPSSSDNLSVFSPHTPSGSPSHLNGSSGHHTPPKMVPSESSNSLTSSGPFSPHTPQSQSPACGGTPVHFAVGSASGGSSGVVDVNKVKAGLQFASLEPKSTVPVIVSCAASPNKFTVGCLS